MNVKHHGKEAALSGFILVQSELISLLRLTDMYHGITQRLLGGFGSNFLSFMKRRKQADPSDVANTFLKFLLPFNIVLIIQASKIDQ